MFHGRIHQKQVLLLFCCILPFATVDEFGWWAVPIVAIVAFTLYGIEGIGVQLEDPFGYDKNDIKMDGIIEDTRQELTVLLDEWRVNVEGRGIGLGGMFD
jgi:ion channel-forming bestrophin family protein